MSGKSSKWPRAPRASEKPVGGVFVFVDRDGAYRYDMAFPGGQPEHLLAALQLVLSELLGNSTGREPQPLQ